MTVKVTLQIGDYPAESWDVNQDVADNAKAVLVGAHYVPDEYPQQVTLADGSVVVVNSRDEHDEVLAAPVEPMPLPEPVPVAVPFVAETDKEEIV